MIANKKILKQIETLVKRGESQTLEFKTSTAQLRSAFETVCAFLNSQGGTVLIGVNDQGQLVGQQVNDNTRQEIARELNKIEPRPDISIDYIPTEKSRQFIKITVDELDNKPYSYDGRAFLRNQSTTQRMSRETYEQFIFKRKSSIKWEQLTTHHSKVADLDKKLIKEVIHAAVNEGRLAKSALNASTEEILNKLNLINQNELTNAAVILFGKDENKQFIQSYLKMARFRGTDKQVFIDNKVMRGNAFALFERAMSFLDNYLPMAGEITEHSPIRVNTPAIPRKALREALVNAIVHRDYSSEGGSISVAIYDDRVEIANTGRLPDDIRLQDLTRKHESHPRNPLIANTFYICGMIEMWGRGTQEIVEFCEEAGNPKPVFTELTGSFTVTLPFHEPIVTISTIQAKVKPDLTKRQQEIVRLLQAKPLSSSQVQRLLKPEASKRLIQLELVKLEQQGVVKMTGIGRAIVWQPVK